MKSALLALIFAGVCSAQAPSTGRQKGSIAGIVTNAAGEPLKGATLRLQGQPPPNTSTAPPSPTQAYAASSDAQGNFTFEDVDPGRYILSSERIGYLHANYTASSSSPITPLDLTSGQTLTGIAIKMTPQAVISGRITDEDGDLYPNVRIELARWTYVGGQKRLQTTTAATTNAEGLFSIGGLTAGAYYIEATPQPALANDAIQKGPQESYVTTYYPSVIDASSAVAVPVAAGGTARGMEIRLRKARAFRVRGKLGAAAEAIPLTGPLRLVPKEGPILSAALRDGAFEFWGVMPGVYVLEAGGAAARGAAGMVHQIVTVGSADVNDVIVALIHGGDITGRVSIDGAGPEPQPPQPGGKLVPTAIPVVLLRATAGQLSSTTRTNDDGMFEIHNIAPDLYQVEVQGLAQGTYVKSIRFGSQDVTETALDLTGGSGGTLNVVLSPNAGDIGGVVHGSDGMPLASVTVTLWTPGVPAEGALDFTRSTPTDINGRFRFTSLPPGDYRIAAWEQIDPGLGTVPEFRSKFEDKAAAVKLDEKAHETVEAPLIGRDAIQAEAAKLQ